MVRAKTPAETMQTQRKPITIKKVPTAGADDVAAVVEHLPHGEEGGAVLVVCQQVVVGVAGGDKQRAPQPHKEAGQKKAPKVAHEPAEEEAEHPDGGADDHGPLAADLVAHRPQEDAGQVLPQKPHPGDVAHHGRRHPQPVDQVVVENGD